MHPHALTKSTIGAAKHETTPPTDNDYTAETHYNTPSLPPPPLYKSSYAREMLTQVQVMHELAS